MTWPPPDPRTRWCAETIRAMQIASQTVRTVHLHLDRKHKGSV